MKELVTETKLAIWNEVVAKVNADFYVSRKAFWAFAGRRMKSRILHH